MKVLQIVPQMNIGGVERGVLDLAKFFKSPDKGVENIVISGGGRLVPELKTLGIKHYRLAVYRKSFFSLFLILRIRKIIHDEHIDIVHARSRVPGWLGFFASRGSRAHFITTAHGIYKNKFFSEVMGWGKFVICPSAIVARHMKNNYGVFQEKIAVINRWVDLDKFKYSDYSLKMQNNTVVAMGRISPTKGYEYLIEAFKRVVRFNPYCKLKIVGSVDKSKAKYLAYLKTLVSRNSLDHNVEFCGFHSDINALLAGARVLVAPSVIEESFGRVVVEAFACGVPVVASNLGAFKEIIENGKDGLLSQAKNSEDIADKILKYLRDPAYAKAVAAAARKKVENCYTMEDALRRTGEVYKNTVSRVNILVIKISSLGDLILAIPSLGALRENFPQAKISLLTLKKYYSLVGDCPYTDEVICLDQKYKKFKNILRAAKNLRRKSFDYILDLQNNRVSHLLSFLAFGRYSFGYSLRWGFLLSKKLKYRPDLSPLESQEEILKCLGLKLKQKKLVFWPKSGRSTVSLPDGELIGINIAASARWQSKNWPQKNIIKLAELINKNLPAYKVVLFGDSDAKLEAQKIEKLLPGRPINLTAKIGLADLPHALSRLKVFITPDTATMHLACAVGVPTIALFGPTDPSRHTVKDPRLNIFCEKQKCSFCYRPKCSLDNENLCLKKITPQAVFNKILEIVKK